jgi:subtilisin family serine protease
MQPKLSTHSTKCSKFFSAILCALTLPAAAVAQVELVIADRYIVQRKQSGASNPSTPSAHVTYVREDGGQFFDVVVLKSAVEQAQANGRTYEPLNWSKVMADCEQIKQDPDVVSCDPEVVYTLQSTPNDPMYSSQWAVHDPANSADANVPEAWVRGTGNHSVVVGIIDTGLYYRHEDLQANVWRNPADPVDGIDNDGNGYVDDHHGIHAHKRTNDPDDCQGHGTHVGGIIGATGNNATGITGVNWAVSLATAAITDDNCGPYLSESGILRAMEYFYDLKQRGHNIKVINASYGGYSYSQAEYDGIARLNSADILFAAAAGNEKFNTDFKPSYPADYNLPNVISVGASGPDLQTTWYSNYGESVDIVAPGGDLSVTNGGMISTFSPLAPGNYLYKPDQGTSMAAPMVTGAIALIASQFPELTGARLKEILLNSARRVPALNGKAKLGRFLDVGAMSEMASQPPGDDCPNDPDKTSPGECGCGVPDTDTDKDGTADCNDQCKFDPRKIAPGFCGCGAPETDSDRDGVPDCKDSCSSDPQKVSPGVCGCGVPDTDSDSDGTPNCNDSCASDPSKIVVGVCGCGVADTDSDRDGSADCVDSCAFDPSKTSAGVCGCGVSDIDANKNGTIDCLDTGGSDSGGSGSGGSDVGLSSLVPPRPAIKAARSNLIVYLMPRKGVDYIVELVVTPPQSKTGKRGKGASRIVTTKSPIFLVPKPKRGATLHVRYAFRALGSQSDRSSFSAFTKRAMKN